MALRGAGQGPGPRLFADPTPRVTGDSPSFESPPDLFSPPIPRSPSARPGGSGGLQERPLTHHHRHHHRQQGVASGVADDESPRGDLLSEFLARAWKLANDKARKMGWIV